MKSVERTPPKLPVPERGRTDLLWAVIDLVLHGSPPSGTCTFWLDYPRVRNPQLFIRRRGESFQDSPYPVLQKLIDPCNDSFSNNYRWPP
ncbi:MAG: hypothetical protein HYV28_17505 [Ignavibacteriales bacterium]|nr:hypothetical protein [Ignavibacteriales bacterium]